MLLWAFWLSADCSLYWLVIVILRLIDCNLCRDLRLCYYRFGGRQIQASEDDGSVNHAAIRDLEYDAKRLEEFGAELEAD